MFTISIKTILTVLKESGVKEPYTADTVLNMDHDSDGRDIFLIESPRQGEGKDFHILAMELDKVIGSVSGYWEPIEKGNVKEYADSKGINTDEYNVVCIEKYDVPEDHVSLNDVFTDYFKGEIALIPESVSVKGGHKLDSGETVGFIGVSDLEDVEILYVK